MCINDKIVLNNAYIDEMNSAGIHVPFPLLRVHSVLLTIFRYGSRNRPLEANETNTGCSRQRKKMIYTRFNQIDFKRAMSYV